jgi:hypothetical protein
MDLRGSCGVAVQSGAPLFQHTSTDPGKGWDQTGAAIIRSPRANDLTKIRSATATESEAKMGWNISVTDNNLNALARPSAAHLLLEVRLASLADIGSQPVRPTTERPTRALEKPER